MDNSVYGKSIEISMDGNPNKDTVRIDGEPVPYLRRVVVDSDLDETIVELEVLKVPSGGMISVSGYIISEEDFKILRQAKSNRAFAEEAAKRVASRG